MRVRVDPEKPDPQVLKRAAEVLRQEGVVLFPTDTVYGIGGVLGFPKAVQRINDIKGRDPHKRLTVHLADVSGIPALAAPFSGGLVERAVKAFLPGPLTLILKGRFMDTVGVRVPSDRVSRALVELVGHPVLATSANVSGARPAVTADEVPPALAERADFFLDAGRTVFGGPSTVLDLTEARPRILREGVLSRAEIEEKLGPVGVADSGSLKKDTLILFVCTGNSCRSPLAEVYVRQMLRERGKGGARVLSRGVSPLPGMGATHEAMLVAKEEGLDLSSHSAKSLTDDEIREAGVIFVMEEFHREVIVTRVPESHAKICVLGIKDPIGQPIHVYRECMAAIKEKLGREKGWV
ncbi:MAG: threonylcarbamoyl-AMP synthase [Candidatus Omnitrophica bacterium]|nr:threonylcarbamoyl-AMP synthase [Candidatus Omnitrophota bacterium]